MLTILILKSSLLLIENVKSTMASLIVVMNGSCHICHVSHINMYMLKEMKGRDGHPFLSGYLHHVISYDAKKQWV